MTQDKELLLKDLCARLPYDIIGLYSWKKYEPYNRELTGSLFEELKYSWDSTEDSEYLPYLRPMSSMTDEEYKEINELVGKYAEIDYLSSNNDLLIWVNPEPDSIIWFETIVKVQDWLNAHHFDYRGLIAKGLAIEVTEDNNPYKK